MLGAWLHHDLESMEEISQNADARRIFLKMAAMSQDGRMPQFLTEIAVDPELDDDMKGTLAELATNRSFLLAVEDYLQRTHRFH